MSNIHVYEYQYEEYSSYTNKNGTYYNVIAYAIAPGSTYMSTEVANLGDEYYSNTNDPYFGVATPRTLTATETNTLITNNVTRYVVCNATTGAVIDFYSVLNPVIAAGYSTPVVVI